MKNIHIAAHTHWDREWYFTVRDSYVLLGETFKRVVHQLENNELDSFCLDAQSSLCEDFINFHPEYKERVEKLIINKQLFIGPWYTQTDCLYVSGDSILQNLIYGKKYAQKLGHSMNVAYLPDTFGFNIQMPTIVRNCNIDNILIRRGVDYSTHKVESYFNWKGISNDKVLGVHLYKGYGEMGQLFYDEIKEQKLINYADKICEYTSSSDILIETGGDQTEINVTLSEDLKKYTELSKKYNLLNSNLENFFDSIKNNELQTYISDFRIGSYDRVHRTIGGIRYDIKTENYLAENKIFNLTLPLILIAKKHNIDISPKLIDTCFKKLFENQAHDSMGGCVTDEVYDDIMYRFREINEILDGINNTIAYRIHEMGHYDESDIIIFNTSTRKLSSNRVIEVLSYNENIKLSLPCALVESIKVIDNSIQGHHFNMKFEINEPIPALGYIVASTIEIEKQVEEIAEISYVDNGVFKISYDENFKFEYNGKEIENFITITNMGNEGDTYDFSYIKNEIEQEFKFKDVIFSKKANKFKVESTIVLELPADLESRLENTDKKVKNIVKLTLEIMENSEKIDVKIDVDNQSLSHRLRVKFNTGSKNTNHIASVPFGFIKSSDNEEIIKEWQGIYQEENINVKVLDNLVVKENEAFNLTVFAKGSKEYEMLDGNILVTLFSSTGEFGRANLNTRPGRASGDTSSPGHKMILTPKAQYIGVNSFEFILRITDSFDEEDCAQFLQESRTPGYFYQRQKIDKFAKRLDNKMFPIFPSKLQFKKFSLLELDLHISYIDQMDDKFIIRVNNFTSKNIDVKDKLTQNFKNINRIYATGEKYNKTDYMVGKYSFATFEFVM